MGKPAGVDVGQLPGFDAPGLAELLPRIYPDETFGEPVNRLSRYESGVLIFSSNEGFREGIRSSWNAEKVRQDVVVVVRGRMKKRSYTLRSPVREAVLDGAASERAIPGRKGKTEVRRAVASGRTRTAGSKVKGSAETAPSGARIDVEALHVGDRRCVVRCRTAMRSMHALKAGLRAAGLHPLGDTRGGTRGLRDRPERACVHLRRVVFEHPGTRRTVTLIAPDPPGFAEVADGVEPLERVFDKALARRIECLLDDTTDAFRVLCGDAEGLPGVNIDKFADVMVIHLLDGRNTPNRATRVALARLLHRTFGASAVYQKIAPKDRSHLLAEEAEALVTDRPLAGRSTDPIVCVREQGLCFEAHPLDPLAVGIYLDHRQNRARVRELSAGKRVLNLFAYTCGFSVAAAAGGAAEVVSVDQSRKALAWGKINFALNGLISPPEAAASETNDGDGPVGVSAASKETPGDDPSAPRARYAFYPDEVFEFLRRADRRARKFDLIILDPPTFARMKKPKREFHVEKDLPELIRESLPLLDKGGTLFVSTNYRAMSGAKLVELIRAGARSRKLRILSAPSLPADFAPDPHHHKAVLLRAD